MKMLPLVLGLLAAGAVGALTAVVVTRPAAGPSGSQAEVPAPADPRVADLEHQVDRLSRRVRVLEEIRKMKEAPDAAAAPSGEDVTKPVVLKDAVVTDEVIEEKVQAAVEKSQAERMETIGRRFSERAAQREKDLIARLAEKAGLTAYQQTELGKLLEKRREAMGKFFRSMFASGSDRKPTDAKKIQDDLAKVRDGTEQAIKDLLTPDQYDAYRKERASMRGPGRFMGGGMGPGR